MDVGPVAHATRQVSENLQAQTPRHLGHYGVAERSNSVHPAGKPMNHSTHSGFRLPLPSVRRTISGRLSAGLWRRRLDIDDCFSPSDAFAVGHNPNSIARMRGANVGRWYAIPFSIVPERGQVPENIVKATRSEGFNVLQQEHSRSKLPNDTSALAPQPGTLVGEPAAISNVADALAREAGADGVHGSQAGERFRDQGTNVFNDRDSRPVLSQHAPAEGIDFAEGDGLEPARALEAEVKASDAGEQGEDAVGDFAGYRTAKRTGVRGQFPGALHSTSPANHDSPNMGACVTRGRLAAGGLSVQGGSFVTYVMASPPSERKIPPTGDCDEITATRLACTPARVFPTPQGRLSGGGRHEPGDSAEGGGVARAERRDGPDKGRHRELPRHGAYEATREIAGVLRQGVEHPGGRRVGGAAVPDPAGVRPLVSQQGSAGSRSHLAGVRAYVPGEDTEGVGHLRRLRQKGAWRELGDAGEFGGHAQRRLALAELDPRDERPRYADRHGQLRVVPIRVGVQPLSEVHDLFVP